MILSTTSELNGHEVLYQEWAWENIVACSFILPKEDFLEWSDEELKNLIRSQPVFEPKSGITLERTEEHIFVNFNFREL